MKTARRLKTAQQGTGGSLARVNPSHRKKKSDPPYRSFSSLPLLLVVPIFAKHFDKALQRGGRLLSIGDTEAITSCTFRFVLLLFRL